MEAFLHAAWHTILTYGWHIALASAICIGLELITAHERASWSSRLRGAFFWVIYLVITGASLALFTELWSKLHVKPLVTLDVDFFSHSPRHAMQVANWIIAPLLASAISEFFYYWFHRAQHTFPAMWRFHAVHHSLREMNGLNNNHHFTEELFRIPFITIPMSLVMGVHMGLAPWIVLAIIGMQGQYEHSTTKLHFGWLRYVIADNRYHRLHHTIHREDWGRNFGSFVPLWDIVFRTARFPKKGEWPAVGIPDVAEPKTLHDFLTMPFTLAAQERKASAALLR